MLCGIPIRRLSRASSLLAIFALIALSLAANPTVEENRHPGTTDWRLDAVHLDRVSGSSLRSPRIEGYASRASLYPGESVALHVSTAPAAAFSVDVYRMGYYGGTGGRHMMRITGLQGSPRAVPASGEGGLRECAWPESLRIDIPSEWASGAYLAKLTRDDDGYQSYAIFIVKSRQPSDILVQYSDLTWQSYNKWPGADSLYDHESRTSPYNEYLYTGRESQVSFDRPYALYAQLQRVEETVGSGGFLLFEFPLAFWLERQGYHVSYGSNLDTDSDPAVLERCRIFLSVAHDEYWTGRALEQVTAARDRGVSLGFLSGNALLHEVTLEPSSTTGQPDRRFHREAWMRNDARPVMGSTTYGPGNGDWVVADADHWLFAGTALRNGSRIPGLIGWEYHGPPYAEIDDLIEIAGSELRAIWSDRPLRHGATIYPGPRDNWIFNVGTIWWSQALAEPPGHVRGGSPEATTPGPDPRVQRITRNFLQRCIADSRIRF